MAGPINPSGQSGKYALNRRTLVGGAALTGAAALHAPGMLRHAAAQDATPITVDAGPPPAGIFESQHEYPLTTEPTTFRIAITSESPDRVGNETTQWLEELTGVKIEWLVLPAEGAIEQMTLQLASGDYPDAFMGFIWTPITPTQLAVYGEQGQFIDLKDLLADNAPNFNAQAANLPAAVSMVTAPSGAIYSLPQINDCYHCSMPQKMWINQAWLDTLGLEIPTTPDEFKTVLQAFKDSDPNGNGEADEIPMTVSATTTLGDLDGFLMNPFQLSPGEPWIYVGPEGQVTAAYTQDGWREGIKYMRDLFANGLLDPESFTQDTSAMEAKTKDPTTAKIGAVPSFWKATHFDFNAPYFKEYVAIPQLTGPTGLQQTFNNYRVGFVGGLMITDKCADPGLLIRLADTLYTTEGTLRVARGTPGRDWRWAKQGEIGINEKPAIWAIVQQPVGAITDENRTSWFELCPMFFSRDLRHGQAVVVPRDDETETILYDATLNMQEPWAVPPETVLPQLFFTAEQAEVIALNGTDVNNRVRTQYATWVTGGGDPDAEWETYLEQLRSVGFDDLLVTYQQAYDDRAQ
jgi:putative aldouronate transport system substrate-binding protein